MDDPTSQKSKAWDGVGSLLVIRKTLQLFFIDGELNHTIDEYVRDGAKSVEISEQGYLVYHSGEHREAIFNLVTWGGETVLQRMVENARRPVFTPAGDYVAYWRLTDHTIYCYSVEDAANSGQFDSTTLRDSDDVGRTVNIGIREPSTKKNPHVSDTYGPDDDERLGYISPEGVLLATSQ